jgi:hypothetical protein
MQRALAAAAEALAGEMSNATYEVEEMRRTIDYLEAQLETETQLETQPVSGEEARAQEQLDAMR